MALSSLVTTCRSAPISSRIGEILSSVSKITLSLSSVVPPVNSTPENPKTSAYGEIASIDFLAASNPA